MSAIESLGVIPGLEVREKIGSGGMGAVFKAYQPALDRVVALKTVRPEFLTPDGLRRFQSEARLLARCTHPNIVRILEFHPEPPVPHFLMEYVDGIPLDQALNARTWKEKARLFQDVVTTVASAHGQGVVHGDLKPNNILIDRRFQPHVLDFGLARLSGGEAPQTGASGGTPNYLAPEIYDGAPTSVQSDIYALGVTLYHLLTGLMPWKTLEEMRAGRPRLPVELDSDVPEPLQRICLKAMERRPEDRYHTAEQLQRDLERFGAGKPVFVRPTRYLEELDRRIENHLRDVALWEREGFVNQRERDGIVYSYRGVLGGDSPWLSDTRTLLTGTLLVRVGSWLLLLSSLLWPVFYWDELGETARFAATGVPAALMVTLGVAYLARRDRRYALACLGTSVLLVLVFEVTLMADFRWLEYRQRPEWEFSTSWRPPPPSGDNLLDVEVSPPTDQPPKARHPAPPKVPAMPRGEDSDLNDQVKANANPNSPQAGPGVEAGGRLDRWRQLALRHTGAESAQPGPVTARLERHEWGDRREFLLSNSQLFFTALTATLCLATLLGGLRTAFFAPWLAVVCLALFGTLMLLVGDKERLLHAKVAWVALHFLGFVPGQYLLGYVLERAAGSRVARPFYIIATATCVIAAVLLAGFATDEWFGSAWAIDNTVWNVWLAAYSVPFFFWAWLTERYGTEGQRALTWWLYLFVPIFLLFPLQVLFAKGPTLFTVGDQPLHLIAALYVLACVTLQVLGRLLHLELFLVAGLWGLAIWVFRMTYRHFWEQEGWALAIALTGALVVALGVWQSWRSKQRPEARRKRLPTETQAGSPAASSAEQVETAALPA